MSADDAAFLAQLPAWAFATGLLIARVGGACMLLPGIGELELPATVRAGFTLALVAVLLPVVAPQIPPVPGDALRAAGMVAAELATGLWLGWLTRLLLVALPMAGQIAAGMAGLTNVLQPDPALGPQTAAMARLLALAAPAAVLASGLHVLPLSALAGSYTLVPPGALLPAADSAEVAVGAVGESFALSLRLAAPFVLAGTVWQVALGLLARLVPQLQVYFAAMPGQILGGILLLGVLGGAMLAAWQADLQSAFAALPGL
ncbi:flagellar biosynthetic protein FliR [Limobrevibacterium gyesilva]|uniref:Flagellar biosynthetic protein FliR n=1 Tax=Limobrevibacterium gyesilva TaxID=2991712 RepID=A0AA42CFN3_9PROT|nr:flagellar biosynthetic protein FliR [Limobrevibacterium gyesilva]MCW3475096.1 flagellar biosynthetic protein FliR [Limobrevibacterium gyesilva]